MIQKTFFVLIMMLFYILTLPAYNHHGRGYGNMPYYGDDRFTVNEYTGKLILEKEEYPEIDTKKSNIQLLIPYETVENLELKNGDQIRVKGTEFRKRFFIFKWKKVLLVNEIEVNGEIYSIISDFPYRNSGRFCW